jgi:hypothetical protein
MLRAFAPAFLKRSPNISPTCRPASGQMGRLIPWFLRRLILNPEKGELLTGSSDDLNATLAILGTCLRVRFGPSDEQLAKSIVGRPAKLRTGQLESPFGRR